MNNKNEIAVDIGDLFSNIFQKEAHRDTSRGQECFVFNYYCEGIVAEKMFPSNSI